MRHTVTCGLPRSSTFSHIISNGTTEKKNIEHEMCFDFLYKFCLTYFSF
jgi:hypothetical protein